MNDFWAKKSPMHRDGAKYLYFLKVNLSSYDWLIIVCAHSDKDSKTGLKDWPNSVIS